jgi:hypothetical protein
MHSNKCADDWFLVVRVLFAGIRIFTVHPVRVPRRFIIEHNIFVNQDGGI